MVHNESKKKFFSPKTFFLFSSMLPALNTVVNRTFDFNTATYDDERVYEKAWNTIVDKIHGEIRGKCSNLLLTRILKKIRYHNVHIILGCSEGILHYMSLGFTHGKALSACKLIAANESFQFTMMDTAHTDFEEGEVEDMPTCLTNATTNFAEVLSDSSCFAYCQYDVTLRG